MARTLRDYPQIQLKPENLDGKIDFVGLFGRLAPLHIEIGAGKGTFLVREAKSKPDDNFLGIEWAGRYYRYAVDRIGRWGLVNVRIIRTDAAVFLAEHVPDECVDYFHIYFPDPWHKRRHNKRRLICPANLEHLIRCLKTNGQIRIATDHADYFEQIRTVMTARREQLEEIEFVRPSGAETGEWTGTNFERKYIKDKRRIYTIAVRKTQFGRA
ncbi:MAG: tRNA (guanosine(46)-N7)-methyltransferase TrmB [Phycisphaerales bacterium]|nr:MAG: tRNA (guanosine(46)-N7)-methyltransferase TrmB [Phycisphaerales bacterium]